MPNDDTSYFEPPHRPVLYQEIILALRPKSPGRYVDATIGAGGHAWGILEASSPRGQLLGLDVDPQALAIVRQRFSSFVGRVHLVNASYTTLQQQMLDLGWDESDGIVLDLGVSSMQLDTPGRGFSFRSDGPLDMRFDPAQPLTAAGLVNQLAESELAGLIRRYGEEPQARRIARAICQARPLETTRQLTEVVTKAVGARTDRRIHPATRTFQALRMAVNRELEALEAFLPRAVQCLAAGARLAVISFHSLEDRLVKQYFRRESRDCICPPRQPVCTCNHRASLLEVNRRPIVPGGAEIEGNPRARSARLRIVEKCKLA